MNGFNTALNEMMDDIFMGINISKEEENAMMKHFEKSNYSRMHIVNVRRDEDGVLSVKYDDGMWIRYQVLK